MTGRNFAPKKPLQELAQNKPVLSPNKLGDELYKRYQQYKKRDYEAFVENCDSGKMVSNLRTGKLLLMRAVRDGRYIFQKREGRFSDNKTVGGQFQFYSTQLLSEWLSSRPELDPVYTSDDDQIEELMSGVKIVEDHYSTKFYTTDFETKECHSAMDFGTWLTRYRWDPDKKDVVCELLDFPACRWDIRYRAEESSYFIYESQCATSVLEKLLGAEIASDDDGDYDYGQQIINQLSRIGGNVTGAGKTQQGNYSQIEGENRVIEMWLQPEAYCDIDVEEDTPTVGGEIIPKGQSLLDIFPTGMCVVMLNGGRTIWAIHAENHKEHIVSGIFHAQSFSGVGKGVTDAVDVMKELNDLHSQLLAHTKAHAMPGFGYNSDMISEEQAKNIGKPRKNIPVAFSQAPDGVHSINQVVEAILPGNPANSAFEYKKELTGDLQIAFQVTNLSQNPVLGIESNTATGDKIRDANASQILVPQHLNKAESRKRGAVIFFNIWQKYADKPQFFAMKDKNGITLGKYFSGQQFDGVEVDFEIVSNSQIPKKPWAQEESLQKVFLATGGLAGLLDAVAANPEITGEVVRGFGAKLSIPTQNDIAKVCRRRIENCKQILKDEMQRQQILAPLGIPFDNANLADKVVSQMVEPISPQELYAPLKASWMAALLDSDELQYADNQLRYVVEALIRLQLQTATFGEAERQQDQNLGAVIANLPMVLGEQAMSQQAQTITQQYEAEQAQAQAQQTQQAELAKTQQSLMLKQQEANIRETEAKVGHNRAKELSDDSHNKTLQINAVNHLADIEKQKQIEKSRSKAGAK